MPELRLREAERVREELTLSQEKKIRKLYADAASELDDWSKRLEGRENISSVLRRAYIDQMEKDLNVEVEKIGKEVESTITKNISSVSTAVVKSANGVLNDFGVNITTAYSFVPADVVQAITMGKIYNGDWTLSKAIWSNTKKTQQEIHDIIAKGVLENKSSFEIAKELEKYVNPTAAKPWDWGKIYPGVRRKIDYNAQRLARTLVSHAYQQSFVRTTKDNPFFEGYKWLTANNHRVCPLCMGYAGDVHAEGLPAGVFPKDELPLDHPNGQCTFSVYMTQDTDQIVDALVNWAHGGEDERLDKFAESLGFPISVTKGSIIGPYVVNGVDISSTWTRREKEFAFEIEDVINAQGFDGLPRIVGREEFYKYVQESNFIAQRTYSAPNRETLEAYRNELYYGKWYVDCSTGGSALGQGMYTASSKGTFVTDWMNQQMTSYGAKSGNAFVETMTLDKSAKIIDYSTLIKEQSEYVNAKYKQLEDEKWGISQLYFNKMSSGELTREVARELSIKEEKAISKKMDELTAMDSSSYAAMKGYDAVTQSKGDAGYYTIVLNRTKLIIQGE